MSVGVGLVLDTVSLPDVNTVCESENFWSISTFRHVHLLSVVKPLRSISSDLLECVSSRLT